MGHQNKILCFVVAVALVVGCTPSFGQSKQSPHEDIQLGSVQFGSNSSRLTKEAKVALNTYIKQMQSNPTLQVKAVSFSKDLCDKCSNRSWKRTGRIFKYLFRHGISKVRLVSSIRLEGELNRVDIFWSASTGDTLHPNIRKQNQ